MILFIVAPRDVQGDKNNNNSSSTQRSRNGPVGETHIYKKHVQNHWKKTLYF